ncbi:TetR/AcrR family transcriptional regulator [Actinomadura sp. 9N407]|uniref:TetR/AcrR family transcriptional regulator n=1 Tax=Actinomadura sp. 9N407 TaxID=3375154 RepID=UPI0037AA819E
MAPSLPRPDRTPRYQRLPRDERRDQILGVARRMFTELPYADVSTSAIAEEAGVRRGLLHYYFGTKRELFLEVVRGLSHSIAVQAPPPDESQPLADAVDMCVGLFLDAAEANATTWFAAVDAEGFGRDPQLLHIIHRARDLTVEHMLTVLRVTHPNDTVRAVLRSYSGLADAATRQWLQESTLDRGQVHTLLARSLLTLLTDIAPAVEQARTEQAQPEQARVEEAQPEIAQPEVARPEVARQARTDAGSV